ncbi:FAD-binding oxidoreductase [Streptomyces sp. NPDC053499]|uniref:FAD-binding oxidoreductase n=1 Tax=Streptomyces sp. NPDC053499 TaxID=3365707 RepID=UPI0037D8D723
MTAVFGAEAATAPGAPVPSGPVVVDRQDPRYAELVRGDNHRFVGQPDRVVLVRSAQQAAEALRGALATGSRVAVRSGGHCPEAFVAGSDVRVVIDLSLMTDVSYDPRMNAVAIEAGATVGHVYKSLYRNWGVTLPAGVCTAVGMGGHITGGGYGPLSRLHGLVADHLYAVEVVHVDRTGTVRTQVATREPDDPNRDLWWAHTGGGGGNFGIVTRFWTRSKETTGTDPAGLLPRAPGALRIAMANWSWDQCDPAAFARITGNFMDWHAEHSAPGTPFAGLFASLWVRHRTGGGLTLFAQHVDDDPEAEAKLSGFLRAVNAGSGTEPFVLRKHLPWLTGSRFMGQADSGPVMGARLKTKAAYLRTAYSEEQLATLHRWFTKEDYFGRESLMMLNGYGGAINAVGPAETSSAQRDSVIKAAYSAAWDDPAEDERHLAWLRGLYEELFADTGGVPAPGPRTDGSYINYPDTDLADPGRNTSGVPWHDLYYRDNYPALQRVKETWDPLEVFRHALSVRLPSTSAAPATEGS